MTGLEDLDTSRLWDLIGGRSKKVLVARLETVGEGVHSIEAVVIDPYAGQTPRIRRHQPPELPLARPLPLGTTH